MKIDVDKVIITTPVMVMESVFGMKVINDSLKDSQKNAGVPPGEIKRFAKKNAKS